MINENEGQWPCNCRAGSFSKWLKQLELHIRKIVECKYEAFYKYNRINSQKWISGLRRLNKTSRQ